MLLMFILLLVKGQRTNIIIDSHARPTYLGAVAILLLSWLDRQSLHASIACHLRSQSTVVKSQEIRATVSDSIHEMSTYHPIFCL